jgi:N6-L-threonylcarbamoyladenine synthase
VKILLGKLRRAVRETGVKNVAISGGVSVNSLLREQVEYYGGKDGFNTFIPAFEYCTDNAGMIAITGYYKYLAGEFSDQSITPVARYPL